MNEADTFLHSRRRLNLRLNGLPRRLYGKTKGPEFSRLTISCNITKIAFMRPAN
jgi:hypothetical protein